MPLLSKEMLQYHPKWKPVIFIFSSNIYLNIYSNKHLISTLEMLTMDHLKSFSYKQNKTFIFKIGEQSMR